MTKRDHGGYDLGVRISQRSVSQIASATFSIAPITRDFPTGPVGPNDDAAGTITLAPDLMYLWFTREPFVPMREWRPGAARPWALGTRSTSDVVTIVLTLGLGSLEITGFRNPLTGSWVDRTDPNSPGFTPPDKRRVDLRGYLQITDRIETRRLRVTPIRENPAIAVDAWCTVVDFTPQPARSTPAIDVWIDYEWALRDLSNPTAALLALSKSSLSTIERRIEAELPAVLAALDDYRLPNQGLLALSISPQTGGPLDPTNVIALTVDSFRGDPLTADSALFTLQRIASSGAPTRTGVWPPGAGDMQIVISNEFLLRRLVFDALAATFAGLDEDRILPGVPVILSTPLAVDGDDPYVLDQLLVFTSDASEVVILAVVIVDRGFAKTTATIGITLSFSADSTVSQGIPVLRLTPIVRSASVLNTQTEMAWWAVLLPIVNFFLGIAALIMERIARDTIQAMLPQGQAGMDVPLPGGVRFDVTDVSLNQADSPQSLPFLPLREHDLVISLTTAELPDTLIVSCIRRDSTDQQRRIDAVGGQLDDGTRWGLTIDDAIAAIDAGRRLATANPDGTQTPIDVIRGPNVRAPYLRSRPDASAANNLLDLPECPA